MASESRDVSACFRPEGSSSGAETEASGGASPGEASVKEANAARFRQTAEREFQAFRKERLATGELECQKLISAAQTHLTQARDPHAFLALQRKKQRPCGGSAECPGLVNLGLAWLGLLMSLLDSRLHTSRPAGC